MDVGATHVCKNRRGRERPQCESISIDRLHRLASGEVVRAMHSRMRTCPFLMLFAHAEHAVCAFVCVVPQHRRAAKGFAHALDVILRAEFLRREALLGRSPPHRTGSLMEQPKEVADAKGARVARRARLLRVRVAYGECESMRVASHEGVGACRSSAVDVGVGVGACELQMSFSCRRATIA